jgi:hypothetical protein
MPEGMMDPSGEGLKAAEAEEKKKHDDEGKLPPTDENPNKIPEVKDAEKKEAPAIDKKIIIADTSESVSQHARDVAESRLTESQASLKGIGGFMKKIWKYNLAREYYRQQEIYKVKDEIKASGVEGNIYAGEAGQINTDTTAHDATMDAIVDRFSSEYEDTTVHREAGEINQGLVSPEGKKLVIDLIKKYAADPTLDRAKFVEGKKTMLGELMKIVPDVLQKTDMYADNMWKVIEQVRANIDAGRSLDSLDLDFQIYVGKAKEGVRTEAQMNGVDRVTEKIMQSKVGRFVNEATVASAVAIASSLTVSGVQKLANSQLAHYLTFGATAVVGALVGGAKESVVFANERRQHARENAQGKDVSGAPEKPRRAEMEDFMYNVESAQNLTNALETINSYETGGAVVITPEQFEAARGVLMDIEARMKLSDTQKIDLIGYSDIKNVEKERLDLDIARATAKVKMRQILSDPASGMSLAAGTDFDAFISSGVNTRIGTLTGEAGGIKEKNDLFEKAKVKHVAKAILKGFITGVIVGVAAEEIGAFFDNAKQGFLEHFIKEWMGKKIEPGEHLTAIEALRQWITGEHAANVDLAAAAPLSHLQHLGEGNTFKLPEGSNIVQNPDHSFTYMDAKGIKIPGLMMDAHGHFTNDSLKALQANGANVEAFTTHVVTPGTEHVQADVKDFVKGNDNMHDIHRHMWYDNDTVGKYDKNELGLHWGGDHGLDGHGSYVMSAKSMLPEGSFHAGSSADPIQLMRDGHLKLLLSVSEGTQHRVFEFTVDNHGNINIPGDSEAGSLLYHVGANGHAVFGGKFAEIAQSMGTDKNGVENFRILATHIGENSIHKIDVDLPTKNVVDDVKTFISMPIHPEAPLAGGQNDFMMPPVIPIVPRTPLEPSQKKQPEPQPHPEPIVVPKPEPKPLPAPEPGPKPLPAPEPGPKPLPAPEPGPKPLPAPEPGPKPLPAPELMKALEYDDRYKLRNVDMKDEQAKLLEEAKVDTNNFDEALSGDMLKHWKDQETINKGVDYQQMLQEALHNSDQFADGTDEMEDYLAARMLAAWGRLDTRNRIEQQKAINDGKTEDTTGGINELGRVHYESDPKQVEWAKTHAKVMAAIARLMNRMDATERVNLDIFKYIEDNQEAIKAEAREPKYDPAEAKKEDNTAENEEEETEEEASGAEAPERKGIFRSWLDRYNERRRANADARKRDADEQTRITDLNNAQAREAQRKVEEDAAKTAEQAKIRAQEAADSEKPEETTEPTVEVPEFEWTDAQEARLEAGTLTPEELKAYMNNEKTRSPEELKDKYGISAAARSETNPTAKLALLRDLPIRKLFGLPKEFTYDQFKTAYKQTLMLVNPAANADSASNNELFLVVQEYKNLVTPLMQPAV